MAQSTRPITGHDFHFSYDLVDLANEYLSASTDPVDLEAQAVIQRTWDLTAAKALTVLFDVDRITETGS